MLGSVTLRGRYMIMVQTCIATLAFSVSLLAFCAGAGLTIWATSTKNIVDLAAAKFSGYFVMILAVVALVFTSYYIAIGVLNSGNMPMGHWTPVDMSQHQMHKQADSKPRN